jgi:hypothetical protein
MRFKNILKINDRNYLKFDVIYDYGKITKINRMTLLDNEGWAKFKTLSQKDFKEMFDKSAKDVILDFLENQDRGTIDSY